MPRLSKCPFSRSDERARTRRVKQPRVGRPPSLAAGTGPVGVVEIYLYRPEDLEHYVDLVMHNVYKGSRAWVAITKNTIRLAREQRGLSAHVVLPPHLTGEARQRTPAMLALIHSLTAREPERH
jgi:hypothetical protein